MSEIFKEHILNQKVSSFYWGRPKFIVNGITNEYYTFIQGITFENGYTYASQGGGCSGEDCNSSFIIDKNNIIIEEYTW